MGRVSVSDRPSDRRGTPRERPRDLANGHRQPTHGKYQGNYRKQVKRQDRPHDANHDSHPRPNFLGRGDSFRGRVLILFRRAHHRGPTSAQGNSPAPRSHYWKRSSRSGDWRRFVACQPRFFPDSPHRSAPLTLCCFFATQIPGFRWAGWETIASMQPIRHPVVGLGRCVFLH